MRARFASCRIVLVSLLLAAPVLAADWPAVPLPPATRATMVDRHIVFNGLDMHAQVFASSLSPDRLIAFYRQTWHGRLVLDRLGDTRVIGRREGDYFVTVRLRGEGGGSRGQIGIVDLASARSGFQPGAGLPRPAGAKVYNDIVYPDDPTPARTVAMHDDLSPLQNASYFRRHLRGDGWRPSGPGHCGNDDCLLNYRRGDSTMALLVMRMGDGHSQVLINLLHPSRGSP